MQDCELCVADYDRASCNPRLLLFLEQYGEPFKRLEVYLYSRCPDTDSLAYLVNIKQITLCSEDLSLRHHWPIFDKLHAMDDLELGRSLWPLWLSQHTHANAWLRKAQSYYTRGHDLFIRVQIDIQWPQDQTYNLVRQRRSSPVMP